MPSLSRVANRSGGLERSRQPIGMAPWALSTLARVPNSSMTMPGVLAAWDPGPKTCGSIRAFDKPAGVPAAQILVVDDPHRARPAADKFFRQFLPHGRTHDRVGVGVANSKTIQHFNSLKISVLLIRAGSPGINQSRERTRVILAFPLLDRLTWRQSNSSRRQR